MADITSNLELYLKLDAVGASDTDALDSSGNGYVSTLNGGLGFAADGVPGQVGNALAFDGVNDAITTVGLPAFGTGDFTVAFWILPNIPFATTEPIVVSQGFTGAVLPGTWLIQIKAVAGAAVHILFDGWSLSMVGGTLTNNIWSHVAFSRVGDLYTIYQDGILVTAVSKTGLNLTSTSDVITSGVASFYNNSPLDEVRFYLRGLSAADVTALYNYTGVAASTAAPPCAPDNILGLLNWYDAFDLASITKDGSNKVSQWNNKITGTNVDLVQTDAARQPLYMADDGFGKPVVRFDGVDDFMAVATATAIQPLHTFISVALLDHTSRRVIFGTGANSPFTWDIADSKFHIAANTDVAAGPVDTSTTRKIIDIEWNGVSSLIRFDGVEVASGLSPGTKGLTNLLLGARIGGLLPSQIDVGGVLIYDNILTAAERQTVYHSLIHGPADAMPVPKLYYKLDRTTGTTALDSSGNGHNGVLKSGLDFATNGVAGQVGRALTFTGQGHRITVGDLADFKFTTGPFSLSCWFKTSLANTPSANRTVLIGKKLTSSGIAAGYNARIVNGKLQFSAADGVAESNLVAAPTVNDGAWHFMCCTMSATKGMIIYVDQETPLTQTHTLGSLDNTQSLTIGMPYEIATLWGFEGEIDEVRIHDHQLSAAEYETLRLFTGDAFRRSVVRDITRDIAAGIAT